ncbi:MAG: hypothetical protein KGK30_08450, partial [Elusimicrobia bacterium]|nr:hypothetical protein [Elusimicrobiota bacterium]
MTGVLLLVLFCALAGLMYSGRASTLLALPGLALAITFVAAAPAFFAAAPGPLWHRLLSACSQSLHLGFAVVAAKGVPRLQTAIFTVLLGGVFGQQLKLTGVAESLVRQVAELGGDNPFLLTLLLTLCVSVLMTTLTGLGSVILLANVYLPVLLSLSLPPLLAASLFLVGTSLGGIFNLVNWSLYIDVLRIPLPTLWRYAIPFGGLYVAALLVFMAVEFKRARLPVGAGSLLRAVGLVAALAAGAALLRWGLAVHPGLWPWLRRAFIALVVLLLAAPRRLSSGLLAPLLPIGLVLVLGWPINAAFLFALIYLWWTAPVLAGGKSAAKILAQSTVEGLQSVSPAVGLMMGIGMLLVAVSQPVASAAIEPLLRWALPRSGVGYVLFFSLLAPLAL